MREINVISEALKFGSDHFLFICALHTIHACEREKRREKEKNDKRAKREREGALRNIKLRPVYDCDSVTSNQLILLFLRATRTILTWQHSARWFSAWQFPLSRETRQSSLRFSWKSILEVHRGQTKNLGCLKTWKCALLALTLQRSAVWTVISTFVMKIEYFIVSYLFTFSKLKRAQTFSEAA